MRVEPVRDATFTGRAAWVSWSSGEPTSVTGGPRRAGGSTGGRSYPAGRNWFTVHCTGRWQGMPILTRTPSGDLLMLIDFAGKSSVRRCREFHQSRTNSRVVSNLPAAFDLNEEYSYLLHTTHDQRLLLLQVGSKTKQIRLAESKDGGKTWSELRAAKVGQFPADCSVIYPYNPIIETREGTLLWPGYAQRIAGTKEFGFVLRSTDGGKSWSVASLHGPLGKDMCPPEDGGSETNLAQLPSGEVVAFIRPDISATMWETRCAGRRQDMEFMATKRGARLGDGSDFQAHAVGGLAARPPHAG